MSIPLEGLCVKGEEREEGREDERDERDSVKFD